MALGLMPCVNVIQQGAMRDKKFSIINSENSEVVAGREMKVRFGQSELLFKIVEVSFVGPPMEIDVDELWKPQTI